MFYDSSKNLNLLSGFLILLLAACGGGSSGSNVQTGGIDRSGSPATSTSGPISGFGSVIVNGIRYHSDKASITASDNSATESDLQAGMQVTIVGTLNTDGTGEASTIEFFPSVVGSITAIDTSKNQIQVLGQTITITNSTLFSANVSPNFIDGLKTGDFVQVSGQRNETGVLFATRIDVIASTNYRLLGKVTSLDTVNFKFQINGQVINYAGANLKNFNSAPLTNNIFVFVVGTSVNAQNELVAQTLRLMQPDLRTGNNHAEIAGFITRFGSATDFDLGSTKCTTSINTQFDEGSASSLTLGAQISLVGDVNASGVLVATQIHFVHNETMAIAGVVSNVQSNTSGAIVTGSFILDGVTVQVGNLTRVEDKSNINLKKFNLSDLKTGDFVKVSGYLNGSILIATELERNTLQTDNDLKIEGIVTLVLTDSFQVNDRHVLINGQTELRDDNGQTLNSVSFLAIALNKHVEIRGHLVSNIFTATRVEIKN